MSEVQRLVEAMHTASGSKGRYVNRWLELAQTDKALREAFRQVFGKRLPTPQRLGQRLSEWVGTHGELLLEGKYSGKKKAWAYRAITPAELAECNAKREATEAARDALAAEKIRAAQEKQRQIAERLSAHIQVVATPRTEYEYETNVDSTGRITRKPVTDPRTGEPLKKAPPPPSVAVEVQTEIAQSMTRVERMRARYLAHHTGATPNAAGWSDPGGVVSSNAMKGHANVHVCRGLVPW